ncbi:hypothetical protein CKSOR_00655 [Candidatus Kinetoplastibacterium sorsogonicusi]|uniref:Serine aminopeptidase S33 domain-containing protein n=1 Tax=Candidatus Kinetoplastidibacterium kentomonadis TaxID=1576550 RepID=A0A3Q8EXB1_9PROT|nr:alpha/beta hydrolase [Candidatus Kinetoplastibacterium sorsogonicusi]AWD32756.1 hypothetical protein CKSOR_00655 [Candidatus Kinetoplastibacterium sorsogonicusi]
MPNIIENKKFYGKAGYIDTLIEMPKNAPIGYTVLLHPHPMHGGTRDNKVISTMSRVCLNYDLAVFRPNFRGVGFSEGKFDNGLGEVEDMIDLICQIIEYYPNLKKIPIILGGFSFGASIAAQLYSYIKNKDIQCNGLVLVSSAATRYVHKEIILPEKTFLIHGYNDNIVPFDEILNWAKIHDISINLIPNASHFFHGKLITLKNIFINILISILNIK